MKNKNLFLFCTSEDSLFEEACELGFARSKKQGIDWQRQRDKIDHYGFSKVLMLWPRSKRDELALDMVKDLDVTVVSTPSSFLNHKIPNNHQTLLLVKSAEELSLILERPESFAGTDLLIMGDQSFRPKAQVLKGLPSELLSQLFFYFSLKESLFDGRLSTRQIKNYAEHLHEYDLEMRPYPGLLYYEKRAPFDLEFYPLLQPRYQCRQGEVTDSIIIPVFNQHAELGDTLKALASQSHEDRYEVIIVDDGSYDELPHYIELYLEAFKGNDQIDYLYLRHPRVYPRRMGDFRFRAGISRNLGLSFARGQNIHFIDADILVSPDYLKHIGRDLDTKQVVQSRRYDLTTKGQGPSIRRWQDVQWERDIDLKDNPYWYDFFAQADQWNEHSAPWKYICTYALSLKRELLEEVGLIRPNYIFYGFEDTDLGYQLYKAGAKFKLSTEKVYHRPHLNDRSEFRNSSGQRNRILSQTAPIFFLNNLDRRIYFELGDFIIPHYGPIQWLLYIASLGFLRGLVKKRA